MTNFIHPNYLETLHRCEITDGVTIVDFLRPPFSLSEWRPQAPNYKEGGTFQGSPMANGRQIVDRQFANIVDTLTFVISTGTMDGAIRATQDLRRLLEDAARYWIQPWQVQPVYMIVQGREETNPRYSTIVTGRIAEDTYPFGQVIQVAPKKRSVWPEMIAAIEHGLWQATPPGTGTAVSISGQQLYTASYETIRGISTAATGSDDAEIANLAVNLTGTSINIGNIAGVVYRAALRFQNVRIPQGSTILSAKLTFVATTNQSGATANFDIDGEAADNPATFSNYADYIARVRTSASVSWDAAPSWTAASSYDSDDITTVIQEIVSRAGFAYGNALCLFIDGMDSSVGAYREFESYESATPQNAAVLTVTYTGTQGQEATTTAEVYFANKANTAPIQNLYNYDTSGGTFSENLINDPVAELFPNPAGNGDIIYFGAENPFCSIVFDLATAVGATGYTAVWEYWNGAAWASAGWIISDNSDELQIVGVSVISFFALGLPNGSAPWAKTTINTRNLYYVRLRITALTTMTTNPTQQNRAIYTPTWPYIEFASTAVLGDISALAQMIIKQWATTAAESLPASSVYVGLRSFSRGGAEFASFVNLEGDQNRTGVTAGAQGGTSTSAADLRAATGESVSIAAVIATLAEVARITFTSTAATNYNGLYRVFLRVHTPSGTQNMTIQAQLYTNISNGAIAGDIISYDAVPIRMGFVDLGLWELPDDTFSFRIYVTTSSNSATYLTDVCFLPADEFQARYYNPGLAIGVDTEIGAATPNYLDAGDVDSPKKTTANLLELSGDAVVLRLLLQQNKKLSLYANVKQRLYFFFTFDVDATADRSSFVEYTGSGSVEVAQRYLSARGNR